MGVWGGWFCAGMVVGRALCVFFFRGGLVAGPFDCFERGCRMARRMRRCLGGVVLPSGWGSTVDERVWSGVLDLLGEGGRLLAEEVRLPGVCACAPSCRLGWVQACGRRG